jgi:hypothetical protein
MSPRLFYRPRHQVVITEPVTYDDVVPKRLTGTAGIYWMGIQ